MATSRRLAARVSRARAAAHGSDVDPGRERAAPGAPARRGWSNAALARQAASGSLTPVAPRPQPALRVSEPGDLWEREADAVAAQVMSGAPPEADLSTAEGGAVARQAAAPAPPMTSDVQSYLTSASGGSPLPGSVRQRIEPHLGVDLAPVRVHTGDRSAWAADQLAARAVTYQRDIFLGAGESPHDVGLMAHESTHVAQQVGWA